MLQSRGRKPVKKISVRADPATDSIDAEELSEQQLSGVSGGERPSEVTLPFGGPVVVYTPQKGD